MPFVKKVIFCCLCLERLRLYFREVGPIYGQNDTLMIVVIYAKFHELKELMVKSTGFKEVSLVGRNLRTNFYFKSLPP